MTPLKPGDRVRCYHGSPHLVGSVCSFSPTLGLYYVEFGGDGTGWVHRKAMRRLVKKKRRVWNVPLRVLDLEHRMWPEDWDDRSTPLIQVVESPKKRESKP